jgi:nucleoside 2-deoxyribosyltransferase
MSTRFYVAATLSDRDLASRLIMSAPANWMCTFNWTEVEPAKPDVTERRRIALCEVAAVQHADLLVLLLPGARGSHTELGVALGADIPVYITYRAEDAPARDCAFYWHPAVQGHIPVDDLLMEPWPEVFENC